MLFFSASELGDLAIPASLSQLPTAVGVRVTLLFRRSAIRAPQKGKGAIEVLVPKAFTKAQREDIRFSIEADDYGGHETLLWYLRRIRPLVPGAASNPYFLPSPKFAGKPLSDKWFEAKFQEFMREIVHFPMTPHQFRHGQTSLLLHKHPEEILVIARRIGDTVKSMRQFYAFIDAVRAMKRGQTLIAGLIEDRK